MEVSTANLKLQQLEAEVQDLSSQESKDEASLAKVKKQLRDLEAKVKDQEEELDEQAGSIQMLEQVLPSYSATEKHPPPREAAYTLNFFVDIIHVSTICKVILTDCSYLILNQKILVGYGPVC